MRLWPVMALALCLVTGIARAQPSDARREQARELFTRGIDLAKLNRWRDALAAFEQAAVLYPHASTSYNIGYCERGLGRHTRAFKALTLAIAQEERKPGSLSETERVAATRYRDEARSRLATLTLIRSDDDVVRVAIGGRPIERWNAHHLAGTRAPGEPERLAAVKTHVLVDPGQHVVLVRRGERQRILEVELSPGEDEELRLSEPKVPASAPEPVPEPLPRPSPRDSWTWNTPRLATGIGLLVASAALSGISIGLAVDASTKWDEAATACPGLADCPDDRGFALTDAARDRANVATLFVAGAAAAAIGGTLLLVAAPVELRVAPTEAWLTWRL